MPISNASRRKRYADDGIYRARQIVRANDWYKKNSENRAVSNKSFDRRASLLWTYAKQRAKNSGVPFAITRTEIRNMMLAGHCPYTGMPFSYELPADGVSRNPWAPSLDRINATLGYVAGNVEVVSTWYNLAKNEWPKSVIDLAVTGISLMGFFKNG